MNSSDVVDPTLVPRIKLPSGSIPAIGLGTFGSDRFTGEEIAAAVFDAAAVGYRLFDCAAVYGNEHLIGPVLDRVVASGIPRSDLFITSKVWNDKHAPKDVAASCEQSLRDLHLDYLDLYIVHWPFPNFHPKGAAPDYHNPDAKPYIHENFMKTWRAMESLVSRGLVRNIGTSSMTIPKLKLVLRDAKVKPAINELELHPHFQQPELFKFLVANSIVPIGFCPIGSPTRPDRDRTPQDTVDIEDPVIVAIAKRLNVHPAVICVKWSAQRGAIPIPMSVRRPEFLSNLRSVTTPPLTSDDMAAISKIDRNCRLIKGQVFLWRTNQSWRDLWDESGEITPP